MLGRTAKRPAVRHSNDPFYTSCRSNTEGGCPFFFSKGQGKGKEKEEKWRNFMLLTGIEPGPSACDAIFLPTTVLHFLTKR